MHLLITFEEPPGVWTLTLADAGRDIATLVTSDRVVLEQEIQRRLLYLRQIAKGKTLKLV